MDVTMWIAVGCGIAYLVLLAALAVDRKRVKHQLDNAEGALTGMSLDLQAVRERLQQMQSYLNSRDSWAVDAVAPAHLHEPARGHRQSSVLPRPAQPTSSRSGPAADLSTVQPQVGP